MIFKVEKVQEKKAMYWDPNTKNTRQYEELSDDERTAVEMRYLQDPSCPLREIARALNRPTAKAVAGLLARGLEKLRGLLREDQ